MSKKLFFLILISIILTSCVKKRDLSKNTVIAHILSQPDGLHPYNDNSVMRSFIFEYTQKTLTKLDLESLEYTPILTKNLAEISEDGQPNASLSLYLNLALSNAPPIPIILFLGKLFTL